MANDVLDDRRRTRRPGTPVPHCRTDPADDPVFHGWYQTHTALADNILFVLVGLIVLSWLFSLLGRVWSFIQEKRDARAAVEYFKYRVRKARENGEDTISTEGLWR